MITFFQIRVVARAVITVIRHIVYSYVLNADLTADSLTAPHKEFSTGPPAAQLA